MTTESLTFLSTREADTERLGQELARVLPRGCTVALNGPLGAGKTRLVQAIAVAAGADRRDVVSPTFVLVHEYAATTPIYHFDAYRLRDDDEFLQLGAEEYFAGPNWVFIEWADRVERCLPDERLEVHIEVGEGTERRIALISHGPRCGQALGELRRAL
jgi:tRNA threonylcarbamoyladenosine biosynthesis protein TsaE